MAIDQRLVWGGIAVGGAGIAIYMYRQNKKKQAAATQAQTSATGYGYGYGYGYGLPQTYEPYGYGYGPFGLGAYGGQGQYGYGYYGAGVPAPVPQQATTNAQWSQAAVSALTSAGYDATTVLAALGVYLTGGNLTQDQASVINSAIAAEGYPPTSGPGGYPPAMHVGGGGGTGQGGGGGGGNNVRVPNTVGNSAGTAHNKIVAAKLIPMADPNQKATDKVTQTEPPGGRMVPQGSTVLIVARNKQGQVT